MSYFSRLFFVTAFLVLLIVSSLAAQADVFSSINTLTDGAETAPDDDDELLGIEPITSNADWTPVERDFDGVAMVLVPVGCFMMGENRQGGEQCFDEPFWIGRTEVTSAQYAEFIDAGGYDNPDYWTDTGWMERQSSDWIEPRWWTDSNFNGANQPVVGVSWYEAMAYAEWRGCRLPTEAEWEYAARGPDGLVYPWGDEFIADNLVYSGNSNNRIADVGSRPGGASWVGALDMAGNVWNWMLSEFADYPYSAEDGRENVSSSTWRVMRGGSWDGNGLNARGAARSSYDPSYRDSIVGFRVLCVLSSQGEHEASEQDVLEESIQRAYDFKGSNNDWTPIERDFDGIPMVLVPAGCFMMGSTDEQITYARSLGADDWVLNEQPPHEQCFDEPFWIDKYEVTNEQYGSIGCSEWSSEPDQPRNCVNWFDARDFCEARGRRVPTEAEWEYAARGPDGWIYPWGDEFIADNAVYSSNSNNRTTDVGSRPGGASWVGATDMAGNVWEWTSSLFEPYPYDVDDGRERDTGSDISVLRVLRGGSFVNTTDGLRATVRFGDFPDDVISNFGFRCARSFNAP